MHIDRLFTKAMVPIYVHLLAVIVLVIGMYYVWLWSAVIAGFIELLFWVFMEGSRKNEKS